MTGFVDIHTHILPGVDDGAFSEENALQMLKLAQEQGTRTVVFTPHYRGKFRKNTPELLKERFRSFSEIAAIEVPLMQLYLGQEVYYDPEAVEALAEGRALSMNGTSHVLLEFSQSTTQEQIRKGVEAIWFYGYRPVIAHAERYDALRRSDKLLSEILECGAWIQLNADSILGRYGADVKRFCHKLLKKQQVSFIASDAHDTQVRPPVLRECFLYVHKKYGGEYAHRLFYDNPMAMLENEDI